MKQKKKDEAFAKCGMGHLHETIENRPAPRLTSPLASPGQGPAARRRGNGSTTKSTKGTKQGSSLAQSRFCAFCGHSGTEPTGPSHSLSPLPTPKTVAYRILQKAQTKKELSTKGHEGIGVNRDGMPRLRRDDRFPIVSLSYDPPGRAGAGLISIRSTGFRRLRANH